MLLALPTRRKVLDHGYVELVDMMPADGKIITAIADAARVSYNSGRSFRSDQGLVSYLLYHQHWSPFDQVKFKIIVKAPNFVRDQWFRHWSWDFNAESARYSEIGVGTENPREKYYVPELGHILGQSSTNKQGREGILPEVAAADISHIIREASGEAFVDYKEMLDLGAARELARVVLPHGQYTSFQATTSLRDLMVFFRQRMDEHAQWEIRQYAKALFELFTDVDPHFAIISLNYFIHSQVLTHDQSHAIKEVLRSKDVKLEDFEVFKSLDKREREGLVEWFAK